MQQYDDHVEWLVPKDMHILDNPGLKTMGETIRNMYTGGNLYVDNLAASITVMQLLYFSFCEIKRTLVSVSAITF
mgnify:FL=1